MTQQITPTGVQVHLEHAGVRAQIAQLGAALRFLSVDDTVIVPPFPEDEPAPGCAGVVLAPWPNRIRDGRWLDEGTPRQLAITEPAFGNASHGLLRFTAFEIEEREDAAATLRAIIHPQTGYPYLLATAVTYALTDDGISVTHTVRNLSATPAPVALGAHPYLVLGDVPPRDVTLRVPAGTAFVTDERMLPVGTAPVDAALRSGVVLSDTTLDTGFTDLRRDADGRVRFSLSAADGRSVALWQGEGFDFAQLYTNRAYPGREIAVAIEPMTAPADAFNSGLGIRRLAPGENWTLRWGIAFGG